MIDYFVLLFFLILITVIHELGHVITALAYNKFKGFAFDWKGFYTITKFPIKVKTYMFVCSAGYLFSMPLGFALMGYYNEPLFGLFVFGIGLLDLLILYALIKEKEINPFFKESVLVKPHGTEFSIRFRELTDEETIYW